MQPKMKMLLALIISFFGVTSGSGGMDSLVNSEGLFGGFSVMSESGINALLDNPSVVSKAYQSYADQYGRRTDTGKLNIFKANVKNIAEHNLQARKSGSFELGVNQFTDMTTEEVISKYTGYNSDNSSHGNADGMGSSAKPQKPPKSREWKSAPVSLDWRTYGAVSSVKDQGSCGSCVYFSSTGCHESSHALWHNGEILDLSEQELVDCARGRGNNGCDGGTFVPTFDYLRDKGQNSEDDYPYTGKTSDDGWTDNECKGDFENPPVKLVGWWRVKPDEKSLMEAVANYGPVAVAIHVNDAVMRYRSGILDVECSGGRNHAVLVVGYGKENGKDFWIVKNSWSEKYGEKGFFRLRRNKGNMCDIAGDPVFVNA